MNPYLENEEQRLLKKYKAQDIDEVLEKQEALLK